VQKYIVEFLKKCDSISENQRVISRKYFKDIQSAMEFAVQQAEQEENPSYKKQVWIADTDLEIYTHRYDTTLNKMAGRQCQVNVNGLHDEK
jgi:hypothetical protein